MKSQIQMQIQISVPINEILLEPGRAWSFKHCLLLLSSCDKDWMASPKPRIFLSGLYGKSLPTIILGYSLDNVSIFL